MISGFYNALSTLWELIPSAVPEERPQVKQEVSPFQNRSNTTKVRHTARVSNTSCSGLTVSCSQGGDIAMIDPLKGHAKIVKLGNQNWTYVVAKGDLLVALTDKEFYLYELSTLKDNSSPIFTWKSNHQITHATIDNHLVAFVEGHTLVLFDAHTQERREFGPIECMYIKGIALHGEILTSLSYSMDMEHPGLGKESLISFSIESGEIIQQREGQLVDAYGGTTFCVSNKDVRVCLHGKSEYSMPSLDIPERLKTMIIHENLFIGLSALLQKSNRVCCTEIYVWSIRTGALLQTISLDEGWQGDTLSIKEGHIVVSGRSASVPSIEARVWAFASTVVDEEKEPLRRDYLKA